MWIHLERVLRCQLVIASTFGPCIDDLVKLIRRLDTMSHLCTKRVERHRQHPPGVPQESLDRLADQFKPLLFLPPTVHDPWLRTFIKM